MADLTTPPADPNRPPPPPRRRRRRWVAVLAVGVVVLIVLVLLLPTLLSTSPARSIALGIVNKRLNGKVDIASWSLGWMTGLSADGIRVIDPAGQTIADIQQLRTQLSVSRIVRGDYDLGKASITGVSFTAKRNADGQWNFATLTKPSGETANPGGPPSASTSSKLPNVAGDITVSDVHGTIEQPGKPTLAVSALTANANIPDINSKITESLNVGLQVNNAPAGTISLAGTAQAVKNNQLALAAATAHQTLDLTGIDLQAFAPLLPPGLGVHTLSGASQAHVVLDLTGSAPNTPAGEVGNTLAVTESSLAIDHLNLTKQSDTGAAVPVLQDESLNYTGTLSASLAAKSPTATPDLTSLAVNGLSLKDTQQLIAITQTGTLTLTTGSAAGGAITLHSDIPAIVKVAQAWSASPNSTSTTSAGVQSGVLDLRIAPGDVAGGGGAANGVVADGAVSSLVPTQAGQPTMSPQTIQLHAAGAIGQDQSLQLVDASAKSAQFGTVDLSNVRVLLSAESLFDKLQAATLAVDVPDLKSLQQLSDAFAPQQATPGTTTQPSSAPLRLTSGAFSLHANCSHDAGVLIAAVPNLDLTNVAFTRGPISSTLKPVHAQLSARLTPVAHPPADAGAMQQLQQVQVSQLAADLGVATVSMTTPINISNLGGDTAPTASGALKLDGKLDDICPELAALEGESPSGLPYRGTLSATQTLKSDNTGLSADGGLQIAHFQVLNGNTVTFTEDQLTATNTISLSRDLNDLKIANLSAKMQSSGALGLLIQNGSIDDLQSTRKLSLAVQLNYDLAKLWPIIHPMLLTPGQPDSYADVKLTGAFQKTFNVGGAYPAGVPSTAALAQLILNGDLAVDDFEHSGLTVQKFDLPIDVAGGMLVTRFAGKPSGQNAAPPAVANGGQLDLSNYVIDLKQSPPRLNTATPNKVLLQNVSINPLFSRTFLAKIINNPVFAGAQEASGQFTLIVADSVNFPLGHLATQRIPANDGQIDLTFSLANLHIGLQGLSQVSSALREDSFDANVNNGTVKLAGGICTENFSFQTGAYTLGFNGKVALDTEEMMPVTVTFPIGQAVKALTHQPDVSQYVPDTAPVVMTGPITAPNLDLNPLINKMAAQAGTKAALGQLLGGGNPNPNGGSASSQPANPQPQDALNSLLGALQKHKKK